MPDSTQVNGFGTVVIPLVTYSGGTDTIVSYLPVVQEISPDPAYYSSFSLTPWVTFAIFASLPTLLVRSARRKRLALIEQDMPITLELLATLGEAGIAFDEALDRILSSQDTDRPLAFNAPHTALKRNQLGSPSRKHSS